MNKLSLLLVLLSWSSFQVMAGDASHFDFNEAEMQRSLQKVEAAEGYVLAHPGINHESLAQENSALAVNLSAQPVIGATQDQPVLGIPSWIWGFVLSIVGLALIYFITEDQEETQKALWGCVASTVIGVVFFVFF